MRSTVLSALPTTFVLGVDLDGVCADYEDGFRSAVAARKGVAPEELGPQRSWDFVEWGVRDRHEFLALHHDAVVNGRMFRHLKLIPGASEVLWRLSQDHDVWIRIVTHRLCVKGGHQVAVADTVAWLDENAIPYRDLCFIGNKPDVGAHLYIDDSPANVAAFRASGVEVAVFDQLYNRHVDGLRVSGWDEVERLVVERIERLRTADGCG
jgi:5'(3')-deoxyribonucleotidase